MKAIQQSINILSDQLFNKFIKSLILCLCLHTISLAATRTSTATGGNWNSSSTWSTGVIPVAGDNVVIVTTGTNAVTVDGLRTCLL